MSRKPRCCSRRLRGIGRSGRNEEPDAAGTVSDATGRIPHCAHIPKGISETHHDEKFSLSLAGCFHRYVPDMIANRRGPNATFFLSAKHEMTRALLKPGVLFR